MIASDRRLGAICSGLMLLGLDQRDVDQSHQQRHLNRIVSACLTQNISPT